MIRQARSDELYRLVEMSAQFYPHTHYFKIASFDTEYVSVLIQSLIDSGVMLVSEEDNKLVGMVGLVPAPFPFNPSVVGIYEMIWWVEPEYQGHGTGRALLRAIDPIAKEMGASYIHMVCMANSPIQAAALYIEEGYEHTEMSFTKRI
jgi:GNAT superfamily N-acetyltransferase